MIMSEAIKTMGSQSSQNYKKRKIDEESQPQNSHNSQVNFGRPSAISASQPFLKTTDKILSIVNSLKGSNPINPINPINSINQINSNNFNNFNNPSSKQIKPTPSKIKIDQNSAEKSFYVENRLNSMSHIRQINSKYRNTIIPVLPVAINKI